MVYNLIRKIFIRIALIQFRFSGYTFITASTDEEIKTACELRRRVFYEKGVNGSDAKLYDDYDGHSVFFLCYHRKQLVGCYRQILNTGELQVARAFNLILPNNINLSDCSELSALIVDKAHRRKSRSAIWGLHALSFQYAMDNKIKWWLGIADVNLIKSFSNAGGDWGLLEEKPLTKTHIKARSRFPNYYKKYNPIPFYVRPDSYDPFIWLKNKLVNLLKN